MNIESKSNQLLYKSYKELILLILFMIPISCTDTLPESYNQIEPDIPEEAYTDPELPFWPFLLECGEEYRISMPSKGITNKDSVYVWVEIHGDYQPKIVSQAIFISSNSFNDVKIMSDPFTSNDLPEGDYDLYLYMVDNQNDIGKREKSFVSGGPYKINVDFSLVETSYCLDRILLGDSIWLAADSVASIFDAKGYHWEPYFADTVLEIPSDGADYKYEIKSVVGNVSDKFVKLDNNLFMPLKISRLNAYQEDSIKWELTFIRDRAPSEYDDTQKVELVVILPDYLGNTNTTYDEEILLWSDYFAVPPQIIKAMIATEESDFDPQSFRYEIIFDHNQLQPNLSNNNHYIRYHIADSARTGLIPGFDRNGNDINQGDSISGLQYDPYVVLRDFSYPTGLVSVDDNDDNLISANELANHNTIFDSQQNDFTSQLLLASSHGLMHTLQVTLIDYCNFQSRNPQRFYNDPSNAIYWGVNNFQLILYDPDYITQNDPAEIKWRQTVGKYNCGRGCYIDTDFYPYVVNVFDKVDDYQPIKQ